MKINPYRTTNLKSTIIFHGLNFMAEVSFWLALKDVVFLRFIHNTTNNNHFNQLLQMGFLRVY